MDLYAIPKWIFVNLQVRSISTIQGKMNQWIKCVKKKEITENIKFGDTDTTDTLLLHKQSK